MNIRFIRHSIGPASITPEKFSCVKFDRLGELNKFHCVEAD
jgi:hypothetical protein